DLGSFFFTMAILCIQFAMCGHILYGDRFEEYSSAGGSIFNMFVFIIAGDWGLINPVFYPGRLGYEYSPLEWLVVWVYIQSNILITFLTLLNMLMAILGDAQGEVKDFGGRMSRKAGGLFTADDHGLYEAPGFFEEALEMVFQRPPPAKVMKMFTTLIEQCDEEGAASPGAKGVASKLGRLWSIVATSIPMGGFKKGSNSSPNSHVEISSIARDYDEEQRGALMELHAALLTLQTTRHMEPYIFDITFFNMKPVVRYGLAIVTKELFEQYWRIKKEKEEEEEVQQSKLAKSCGAMGSELEHLKVMMQKQTSHVEQQVARVGKLLEMWGC
ncbi:hypothetical protein CYMTET_31115, partial [Cymbomonas tetramitiformis]